MSKKERAEYVEADKKALADRTAMVPTRHSFDAVEADHCETGPDAFGDIASVLRALAASMGKTPATLRIYDPYYCTGAVVRHLGALGFPNVHNVNEDFYAVAKAGAFPPCDVLLTNPAYSGDHIPRLMAICVALGKPLLLLMPSYVAGKPFYAAAAAAVAANPALGQMLYLYPRKRYTYWTPRGGLRSKKQAHSSALGNRTSPFISFWYAALGPHAAAVLAALRKEGGDARLQVATSLAQLPPAMRPAPGGAPSAGGGAGSAAHSSSAARAGPSASSGPAAARPAQLKRERPGHWRAEDDESREEEHGGSAGSSGSARAPSTGGSGSQRGGAGSSDHDSQHAKRRKRDTR